MTTPIIFLPVDLTGALAGNHIVNEYHQSTGSGRTVIRPNFGDYYASGFQIYGVSGEDSLTLLRHGQDYVYGSLNEASTGSAGAEVYQVVLVKNTQLFTTFSLSYHAYGGEVGNINFPRLYNLYEEASSGVVTPYLAITGTPDYFNPQAHLHDTKDIFGMEYIIDLLDGLKTTLALSRTTSSKYQEIRAALAQFSAAQVALHAQENSLIRGHIDNSTDDHHYTKAMVNFDMLSNYGFTPIVEGMTTLPAYASPYTVLAAINVNPEPTHPAHALFTNNPHHVTKAQIGLGNVEDLPVVIDLNTVTYSALYNLSHAQVYLGPYPFAVGVGLFATEVYTTVQQPLIDAAIDVSNGHLAEASGMAADTLALQEVIDPAVVALQGDTQNVVDTATSAFDISAKHRLLYGNAVYANTLTEVMIYEHARLPLNQNVYTDGYVPVPQKVSGLELWLSTRNPANVVMTDINGHVRVTHAHDLSSNARVFSADANVCPILRASADVEMSSPGITNGNVFAFTPGLAWDRTSGPALRLKPGMTVIALVRTGLADSMLTLLENPNESTDTGIYAFTQTKQSMAIRSGGLWEPLEAPENSTEVHTSGIVVGSIGEASSAFTWLASSSPIDAGAYPKGVVPPSPVWPESDYVGPDLTRIGNANFGVFNEGEIAELIIYNRALSYPEIRSVTDYLKLVYSNNISLTVDFRAIDAF